MPWPSKKPRREIVVYSRADCPLCDEALAVIEKERRRFGLDLRIVDIAGSAELEGRHGERIPVVMIDGRERFFGRVDRVLLRRVLHEPPNRYVRSDDPSRSEKDAGVPKRGR